MKKSNNFYNSLMVKFGFLLHHKFSIHILVLMILNFISAATITGLFQVTNYPLIEYKIGSFIVYIIVVTMIESIVKVFMLRYFLSAIFKSRGILSFVVQMLIFFITSLFIPDFKFLPDTLLKITIFTLTFFLIRMFLINTYQKYILNKFIKKERINDGS